MKHKKLVDIPQLKDAIDETNTVDNQYPHISRKIYDLWGSEYLDPYIVDLTLVETGRSSRNGFSFKTIQELMLVQEIHNEHYGQRHIDNWSNVTKRT